VVSATAKPAHPGVVGWALGRDTRVPVKLFCGRTDKPTTTTTVGCTAIVRRTCAPRDQAMIKRTRRTTTLSVRHVVGVAVLIGGARKGRQEEKWRNERFC